MSCEALLEDHNKTVSALALDPSGARVATGSFDYDLKLWDFGGMTSTFRPFRSFEPAGNYPIHDLGFSHSGEHLLCISGTSQAKVFDRDGTELATYKKGDVYIRDMKNTSGHVAELSCGSWHPQERGTFMTASADSTVRFWDVDDKTKQKTVIVVKSKERGTRTKVTAATLSHDGRTLAAAGLDGALHLWDTRSNYARPRHSVDTAHQRNTETSCIAFSRDSHTLVTRGGSGDDTVKLWDSRNFKRPLAEKGGLPNASAQTDVIFSLDEKSILTGVAAESRIDPSGVKRKTIKDGSDRDEENEDEDPEKNRGGRIAVLSRLDLEQTHSFSISPSSVTRLRWHPKINQIFASTKKGQVHVFYDPTSSSRGALLCVGKRPKPRNPFNVDMSLYETGGGDVMIPSAEIITPGARSSTSNDLHQSQAAKKRKLEKMRQDPKASRMPQRPIQGPGKGGRIGAAATQHLVQSIWKDNSRDEDPREALLKYADEKAKGGTKWTAAWDKNQPITIYSKEEEEEAVEGTQESGGAEGGEE
ncbi:WD40 repeat-like protein [Violaceomyces palustris]|uniref:WD40 repeat-like protein n=1 Tax=Violaceomyces palustris TaxID=1673888 RepID=A0ACD0P2M3_9BASI|nr:WD40 repeat-like protein [Violaceomyces palustris]